MRRLVKEPELIPFPNKKYRIIYADPPWEYSDKAHSGKRGVTYKYETQSDSWICDLPVDKITSENALLFLWVTMPKLQEGLDTIKAWGFEYRTVAFVWIKSNRKGKGLFMGMGNWTRANGELCLLGIKGDPDRINANIHSVVYSPIEGHSKKPNEVRNRIVKLCGNISRIELFAREQVQGWTTWGDQV